MLTKIMKAKLGIFTPFALVSCYSCHGNKFPKKTLTIEEMTHLDTPIALTSGNQFTRCDSCGCFIQLVNSVAVEHKMSLDLKELGYASELHQTGGMNSACAIYSNDNYLLDSELHLCFYMTYNMDGDDKYVLCGYDAEGDFIEDSQYDCDTYEGMLKHIQTIPSLKTVHMEGEIK